MTRRHFGWRYLLTLSCLAVLAAGCATGTPPETGPDSSGTSTSGQSEADLQLLSGMPNGAWESSYEPLDAGPVLIQGGTVMTAAGEEIEGGDVLLVGGRIEAVEVDDTALADEGRDRVMISSGVLLTVTSPLPRTSTSTLPTDPA